MGWHLHGSTLSIETVLQRTTPKTNSQHKLSVTSCPTVARIRIMNFWNSSVCFLSWACKSSQRPIAWKDHSIKIFQANRSESKHWSVFVWVQKKLDNFGTTDLYISLSSLLQLCNDDVHVYGHCSLAASLFLQCKIPNHCKALYPTCPVAVELTFFGVKVSIWEYDSL